MSLDSGDRSILGIVGVLVVIAAIMGGNEKAQGAAESEKRKCLGQNPENTWKMLSWFLVPFRGIDSLPSCRVINQIICSPTSKFGRIPKDLFHQTLPLASAGAAR